jgi:hypothetical protein
MRRRCKEELAPLRWRSPALSWTASWRPLGDRRRRGRPFQGRGRPWRVRKPSLLETRTGNPALRRRRTTACEIADDQMIVQVFATASRQPIGPPALPSPFGAEKGCTLAFLTASTSQKPKSCRAPNNGPWTRTLCVVVACGLQLGTHLPVNPK